MAKVLTENQSLLTRYLAAVGCKKLAVLIMITELWDEDAVLEMLEFCASNPNATQDQLLKASAGIAAKIPVDNDSCKKAKRKPSAAFRSVLRKLQPNPNDDF